MQQFDLLNHRLIFQSGHQLAEFHSFAVLDGLYELISKEEGEIATIHLRIGIYGLQKLQFLGLISME